MPSFTPTDRATSAIWRCSSSTNETASRRYSGEYFEGRPTLDDFLFTDMDISYTKCPSNGGMLNERFVATAVPDDNDGVVIDKLYTVAPIHPEQQVLIAASMNTLLAWYQLELRGRTQLGEGVLEAKIPDIAGVLVLNPDTLTSKESARLLDAWGPIASRHTRVVGEELQEADRAEFDQVYLRVLGLSKDVAEDTRLLLARELREAVAERRTRTESVAVLKAQRTPRQRASRAVDAFAARIVSSIGSYPDPRHFVQEGTLAPAALAMRPLRE